MDKSLNLDVSKMPNGNSVVGSNPNTHQNNTSFNIILQTEKDDGLKPRAFTPTRKPTTFNSELNATCNSFII